MNNLRFNSEEKATFALRSLYEKYGYCQYKMSKFEEYDFYLKNKNFLVSDNIITFTDTDGKLLALKPDVTLSIIKNMNNRSSAVQKVYYNENVYRVAKGTNSFKEIMQTGLECMGNIDDYTILETLMLAAESLKVISSDYILDISDLDIVSFIINSLEISEDVKKQVIKCLENKNLSELCSIEKRENQDFSALKQLLVTYGSISEVKPFLQSLNYDGADRFIRILEALKGQGFKNKIRVDFSIISDTNYYNGFVFKGFINGIPSSVLSGGQYDNLMSKMGRSEKAVGFAVYLDMLERLSEQKCDFDIDTVILYDPSYDINTVIKAVKSFTDAGQTVTVQTSVPSKIRFRQLARLTERGVEIIENNA